MKKILVLVVIVLSIATVVTGKIHWNNKLQATAKTAQAEKPDEQLITAVDENQEDENKIKTVKKRSKNLPVEIQTKLVEAAQTGIPINFIIAGSDSTPEGPTAWPTLLKESLEDTYGKDILTITIKEIADKTSTQVVQEELYREIIDLSPDILLFEPFMLYDNGNVVPLERRLDNITEILGTIKEEVPKVSILIQPANPLHNARYYPIEVNKLEVYAKENNYPYLNHWEAWPDYQSDEIIEYLKENGAPSEKGHKLWADYLSKYFIAQDGEN
ncbi:SGNH/GDSL hydrolase family protein [Fredinandcohnia sp. FSL W7-1320]|uniref:SGNH/GDSL hydrolase family protein n=1 Tax=Fredinandcohnia sp. FSL W7-1320 TaxID=2954540 RepID=UPI0030FD43BA